MSVTPILRPLPGEGMLGVEPPIQRFVDADWHRRLRLFTGRALSDVALIAEQTGRAGRLATRGQMLSPGVVSGLDVALATVAVQPPDGKPPVQVPCLHIAQGFGITVTGEDVFLPSAMVVAVQDVRVYAPAEMANASGWNTGTLGTPTAADSSTIPRRLGARLADYVAKNVALPHAAILLLQPVLAEISGRPQPGDDPCEFDPSEDSLLDFQIADGCRLVYYAWPTDWLPLPTGDPLRNRIAWSIFRREIGRGDDDPMPWEEVGVPIGVAAFDGNFNCAFVDRYAVVRQGGGAKRRTSLLTAENRYLWQARIQQFAEHLADVSGGAKTPGDLAASFRFLPPAGLLPKEAVDARSGSSLFFPSYYTLAASPIPVEQIDAAIDASAGLDPYDLYAPDAVEVLVPVPQQFFDPNLLIVEKPDPAFQVEVDRSKAVRLDALERRNELLLKADALFHAVSGKAAPTLAMQPDPNAMPDETPHMVDANQLEDAFGTVLTAGVYGSTDVADLKKNYAGSPLAAELPRIDDIGLDLLIIDLGKRADQADDTVDIGFLRANTDIYRFRQLLLNNMAATRLATSPALAQIAEGQSASATRDDLEKFLTAAKATKVNLPGSQGGSNTNPAAAHNSVITHSSAFLNATLFAAEKKPALQTLLFAETAAASRTDVVRTEVPAKSGLISAVRAQAAERVSFNPPSAVTNVIDASPIAGDVLQNVRTISIAKRLDDSPAVEARNYALAARSEAIQAVFRLTNEKIINMDDVPIPGIVETAANVVTQRLFGDLKDGTIRNRVLTGLMNNVFDPLDQNPDEATVFANGVRMVEQTISTMRAVEARIKVYRDAIADMQAAAAAIRADLTQLDTRLKTVSDDLTSARQDVATTLALLADENARVTRVNQTRDAVIAAHVTFLVYVRPRRVDAVRALPSRFLDPGLLPSPVPVCLNTQQSIPPDIASMVKLLRDAPVSWFPGLESALERLNRLDQLRAAVQISRLQAQATMEILPYVQQDVQATPGRLAVMIQKSYTAQQQTLSLYRTARAQFDLSLIANRTWKETYEYARQQLSVADLMDGRHGTASLARTASDELDNIGRIATCLFNRTGDVLPIVRLAWAEAIGQYDGPINLRDLGNLPQWDKVPYAMRKELQSLADWLYGQVNATTADAVAAVGDLVRVALLLASHAPVNKLISGVLTHPAPIVPGGRLKIQVDHTLVQVGMQVLLYRQSAVVARGTVEDIATGMASASIIEALDATQGLEQGASAHFVAPGSPQYKVMVLKGGAVK